MTTLDDVYRKFGEAAEAAQLLETELGTLLLMVRGTAANLIAAPNPERATDLYDAIDRQTLGQMLHHLKREATDLDHLQALLTDARDARNRLSHSFYRQHNFRRNSDAGRAVMLADLEAIHDTLLKAYVALMRHLGTDLEAMTADGGTFPLPTRHLPL